MVKKIVGIYLLWRIVILAAIAFGAVFIPQLLDVNARAYVAVNVPYLAWVHANSDGSLYLTIARNGYHPEEPGFFPLFPLVIRLVRDQFFIPRYLYSGLLVANLFFVASLFVIHKLFSRDVKKGSFPLFLLLLLFYPTSFFYSAVYNDGMFLFFAGLTLLFGRKKSWLWASVFAALATLTRLNGLALGVYLLAEFLCAEKIIREDKFKIEFKNLKVEGSYLRGLIQLIWESLRQKFFVVLLIPMAFIGYLAYLQQKLGDWHILFSSMDKWHQSQLILPPQVVYRYLKIFFLSPNFQALNYYVALLEFAFVCFYVFILFYSWRKIAFPYWVFLAVSFLIPSLTGTFQGMPRYSLHLYPFFLCLYLLIFRQNRLFQLGYFAITLLLMLFYIAYFSRGYFVA